MNCRPSAPAISRVLASSTTPDVARSSRCARNNGNAVCIRSRSSRKSLSSAAMLLR
jgi:hypothetical protein